VGLTLREVRQRIRWGIDRIQGAVAEFTGFDNLAPSGDATSALGHLVEARDALTEMIEAAEPEPDPIPEPEPEPPPPPSGVPGSPIPEIAALPRIFESDFSDGWEAWAPGLNLPLNFAGKVIDADGTRLGTIFNPGDSSGGIKDHPLGSGKAFHAVAFPGSGSKREQKTGISIWRHPVMSRFVVGDLDAIATSHTLYLPERFPRDDGLLIQVWQPKLRPGGSGQPWQIWIDAPSMEIRWREATLANQTVHRSGVAWPLGRKVNITTLYALSETDGRVSFWVTPEGDATPIAEFHRTGVPTLTHFRHPDVDHVGFWPSLLIYQIGRLVREDPPVIVPLEGWMSDFVFSDARELEA